MVGRPRTKLSVAFGKVLRRLREQKGLTQEQLGFEADVQRNFISLVELGHNQPTITTLFKLAKALGYSPSKIISLVEKEVRT
jgi:transcriptional regulator with XRE-family HTH domain